MGWDNCTESLERCNFTKSSEGDMGPKTPPPRTDLSLAILVVLASIRSSRLQAYDLASFFSVTGFGKGP